MMKLADSKVCLALTLSKHALYHAIRPQDDRPRYPERGRGMVFFTFTLLGAEGQDHADSKLILGRELRTDNAPHQVLAFSWPELRKRRRDHVNPMQLRPFDRLGLHPRPNAGDSERLP